MSILFLNSHRAKSGFLDGAKLPKQYVLACKFFDCGIIDRTQTLDVGFDPIVLDKIPDHTSSKNTYTFGQVCDLAGKRIVEEAVAKKIPIRVLWSGGIDSTAALISLLKNIDGDEHVQLEVVLSMNSINEYPLFFRKYILNKIPFTILQPPISNHLSEDCLIVTGEHGDQLFGSDKLLPLIVNQLAFEDYELILPIFLMDKFGNEKKVDLLLNYLEPLIKACPLKIKSTFDLFWWLNFTIKWQQVTLRMPMFTFRENVKDLYSQFRHFFRYDEFQIWSLQNHTNRMAPDLESYKLPAKEYIFDFTDDQDYLSHKSKEPSLKNVIIDRKKQGAKRYRVMAKGDFSPIVEIFHKSYKNKRTVL